MKKISFGIFVLLFSIFAGCAASRTVKNNIFESSSPKFVITVAQELDFFKNVKYVEYHKSVRGDRELRNEIDTYYFFKTDPEKSSLIVKSVVLGISESEGIYAGNLFSSDKDLEHGMEGLSDENYEFSTQLLYPRMPEQLAISLKEVGYTLPKCIFIKQYKKIDLENRKQIKFIHYWEDATKLGYACNK